MRILITKFKSLGDVILLTPLIGNLRQAYPNAAIDVLVKSGTEGVLKNNPNLNNVMLLKNKSTGISKFLSHLVVFLKIRSKRYSIVITTDRGEKSSILARLSNAKIKIGRKNDSLPSLNKYFTNFFDFHGERHVIDLNLDPINILGQEIKFKGLEIFPDQSDREVVKNHLKGIKEFIHVHPVSQCDYKANNDILMAKIIDFCEIDLGIKVVITGSGIKDETKISNILKRVESNPINMCSKLSLLEAASLNNFASLLVVVDTAMMHISTANDTPVIAFFGPTAVNNWGPWDKNLYTNSYIRTGGIQTHGKHTTISSDFSCIPCSKSGCENSGVSECLNKIEFKSVTSQIIKILERRS